MPHERTQSKSRGGGGGGREGGRRRGGLNRAAACAALLFFAGGGSLVRPYRYIGSFDANDARVVGGWEPTPPRPPPSSSPRHRARRDGGSVSARRRRHERYAPSNNTSHAPLLYHVSPGSTGSRTLYHAACAAGFPSVHHKSFCVSRNRGVAGVADDVADGARSHYEVLRLYEMASRCCSLRNKGRIRVADDGSVSVVKVAGNGTGNGAEERRRRVQRLCSTPLDVWAGELRTRLESVVRSGLVGLFDTPYPYLAEQVLELSSRWRASPPVIAVTERDPESWAASRVRNHGILVCREEHSLGDLGSSEFDVLGCSDRALRGSASSSSSSSSSAALHFWDAFEYRSRGEESGDAFRLGMERQMELHQEKYLPVAGYAPDFFGARRTTSSGGSKPVREGDVARDIRRLLVGPDRGGEREANGSDDGVGGASSKSAARRRSYASPLTCRGRVDWQIEDDALIELYHLPKTCADARVGGVGDGAPVDGSDYLRLIAERHS